MRTTQRGVRAGYSEQASWRCPSSCLLLACLGLILAAGCVSPEMRENSSSGTLASARGAPSWVGQPLDWGKLETIDRWLERDAQRYDDYWRVQGELVLSEGRLTFSRQENSSPSAPSRTWMARLQSARAGFQKVIADADANDIQVRRAQLGLVEIDDLRDGLAQAPADRQSPYLSRAQWRALPPIPSRLNPTLGSYDRITIHHTAEVPGARFDGTLRDSVLALQKAQSTHMTVRDFGDIGYHILIDPAGRVFEGRDLKYQGAHAGGANNVRNIGVCLIGDFESQPPSAQAIAALESVLADLRLEYRIQRTRIVGHGELKNTVCPGTSLANWTRNYRRSGPVLSQLASSSTSADSSIMPASSSPRGVAIGTTVAVPSRYPTSSTVR